MTTIDEISQVATVEQTEQHKIWDLPVRIFHWLLVLAIVAAFVTNRLGVAYFTYHVWSGYLVIVLVSFRIVWGLVGTRHARFWNFVRGPVATFRYARGLIRGREQRYAGHNPLGALMVVVLLAGLGLQAVLGLFANDEIFNVGPLYGYVSKERSLLLTSLHRQFFYWILAAVALHVLAVVAHGRFGGDGLVKAMVTGRKPYGRSADAIGSSRTWLALLLSVALAGALAVIVSGAPEPSEEASFY